MAEIRIEMRNYEKKKPIQMNKNNKQRANFVAKSIPGEAFHSFCRADAVNVTSINLLLVEHTYSDQCVNSGKWKEIICDKRGG